VQIKSEIYYPEFSENDFSFQLVDEIVNKKIFGAVIRPVYFPTRQSESKEGFDARINIIGLNQCVKPIFFQFKVSEFIQSQITKEWQEFKAPYFRFGIYADIKSHQHNILVDLATEYPKSVFYSAPLFYSRNDFSKFSEHYQVWENVKYICCRGLQKIAGSEPHKMCYNRAEVKMFSQMQPMRMHYNGEQINKAIRQIPAMPYKTLISNVRGISRKQKSKKSLSRHNPFVILHRLGIFIMLILTDTEN